MGDSPWEKVLWSGARGQGKADGSDEKDHWRTPPRLFAGLHAEFDFDLDAAALAPAALVPNYLGPDHSEPERRDALTVSWAAYGSRVFVNPPYSVAQAFLEKAHAEAAQGVTSVVLVFARTGTKWWWECVLGRSHKTGQRLVDVHCAAEIRWRPSRVVFHLPDGSGPKLDQHGRPQSGPAPTVAIVFRPDWGSNWPLNGVLPKE